MKKILVCFIGTIIFIIFAVSSLGTKDVEESPETRKRNEQAGETRIRKDMGEGNIRSAFSRLGEYEKRYPENKEKIETLKVEIGKIKAEKTKEYEDALTRTYKVRDEVEQITYLYPKFYRQDRKQSIIAEYIEDIDGRARSKFILRYHGEDFINIEKAVLNIDGVREELIFKTGYDNSEEGERKRARNEYYEIWDNTKFDTLDDGSVIEWVEEIKYFFLLDKIAASKETIIRLLGENRQVDRVISEEEKQAIRDMYIISDYIHYVR